MLGIIYETLRSASEQAWQTGPKYLTESESNQSTLNQDKNVIFAAVDQFKYSMNNEICTIGQKSEM